MPDADHIIQQNMPADHIIGANDASGRPYLHVRAPGELPESSPEELLETGYILLREKFVPLVDFAYL